VNFLLDLRMRSNSGRSADGIGTEKARTSPPLGDGKVILFSEKSMQFSVSVPPSAHAVLYRDQGR
jgi:hypothetical protein